MISQDFSDYEYIIQDPGSSDGSLDVLRSFVPSIDLLLNEADNGPSDGLNRAFAHARGRYYLFLNSDDQLAPRALANAHAWITRDNQRHDVYSGACKVIDENGSMLRYAYSDSMCLTRSAYGHCILIQPSTIIASHAFRAVGGFNPANRSNWDGELFVDMAIKGFSFVRSRSVLSHYRIHSKGITGGGRLHAAHIEHQRRMYEKIYSRPWTVSSKMLQQYFWIERKLVNLPDTFERLAKGAIYKARP